jgi:hypothetical protein
VDHKTGRDNDNAAHLAAQNSTRIGEDSNLIEEPLGDNLAQSGGRKVSSAKS